MCQARHPSSLHVANCWLDEHHQASHDHAQVDACTSSDGCAGVLSVCSSSLSSPRQPRQLTAASLAAWCNSAQDSSFLVVVCRWHGPIRTLLHSSLTHARGERRRPVSGGEKEQPKQCSWAGLLLKRQETIGNMRRGTRWPEGSVSL